MSLPDPHGFAPAPGSSEPMASSPLWLAHSGLPEWLNAKVNRSAWLVFKTVVEIDCERNARPSTVEIPPREIAERCGLPPESVMRTLSALRRKKCLALFVPDHPEEDARIPRRSQQKRKVRPTLTGKQTIVVTERKRPLSQRPLPTFRSSSEGSKTFNTTR